MKKRLLCPKLPMPGASVPLTEKEAHHATRVLRLREGEIVEAMDGNGKSTLATLRVRGGPTRLEFLPASEDQPEILVRKKADPLPITLEMAVLKGEAMEWVVEKAVELGVRHFIPVLTAHTVVQMKNKGPETFRDRWQKIADQALKQCGRLDRMEVGIPISLEALLASTAQEQESFRLWCDEGSLDEAPYLMSWISTSPREPHITLRLLIGPEGGWSSSERVLLNQDSQTHPSQRVHLGPLILRAETAALFAISLISAQVRSNSSLTR